VFDSVGSGPEKEFFHNSRFANYQPKNNEKKSIYRYFPRVFAVRIVDFLRIRDAAKKPGMTVCLRPNT
jgi:hypothetical protein